MDLDNYIVSLDKQHLIKEALLKTYFKDKDDEFLNSEYGKLDIEANVNDRYLRSLNHIVPWVHNKVSLKGKNLIEIGCGTGSSTAAFSQFVNSITAYDIDEKSIHAAQKRIDVLGIDNVTFQLVTPDDLIGKITADHRKNSADIILLFAVLEHMTIHERHEAIKTSWDLLADDGVLVVVETPNLLQYFDAHTSVLPFFHLLQSELCALYAQKSPRDGFNDNFLDESDPIDTDLKMTRWGRGVSYHDFELTIGPDYGSHIIASGYEPEILSWFPVNIEEEILRFYVTQKGYSIPAALQRGVLNLIICKTVNNSSRQSQYVAPPLSIGTDSFENLYLECNKQLAETRKTLQEILASKRWKIGSLIGMPYRTIKKLF